MFEIILRAEQVLQAWKFVKILLRLSVRKKLGQTKPASKFRTKKLGKHINKGLEAESN